MRFFATGWRFAMPSRTVFSTSPLTRPFSSSSALRRGCYCDRLPENDRRISSPAATSARSGASPKRSNTASSGSTRAHLDRDRPLRRHEGKRHPPRRLEIRHRGIPRSQIPLHGRYRPVSIGWGVTEQGEGLEPSPLLHDMTQRTVLSFHGNMKFFPNE